MKLHLTALVLALALFAAACGPAVTPEEAQPLAKSKSALEYGYCESNVDCEFACGCSENQCVPDGFGPSNPYCGSRPFRACDSISDCQLGCGCAQGLCQPDGFGPANPNCNRAP